MALPSSLYVAWEGVQTYFVNKDTGLPLSAGYVKFFSDIARSVPKNVYQQVQLPDNTYQFVNIGSIVTLTSVGTFGAPSTSTDIQVYGKPYNDVTGDIELYYMEIYSVDNILQFTREAQPANTLDTQSADDFEGSANQIENPQFVETLLLPNTTITINVSGSGTMTAIAPDWYIVTNGSGTVVVTSLNLTEITPSNAPFAIELQSAGGITSLILRQRITSSPRILGTGFISGSFEAKTFGITAVNFTMRYTADDGYTVDLVNQSAPANGAWTTLTNITSTAINTSNVSGGLSGYVDIDIIIPAGANVGITSVQIVSVENGDSTTEFLQESVPRQLDHLFHYYEPQLKYKPIPSYLVGWDFILNPAQFLGTTTSQAIGNNTAYYVYDQTILFQTVTSGLAVTRSTSGNGAIVVAAQTPGQFAMIQYLDIQQARNLLVTKLSSMITAAATANASVTVTLWYTTNAMLPSLANPTYATFFSGLDANGVPTGITSGWSKVPRGANNYLGDVQISLTPNYIDVPLSGWDLNNFVTANTATYFAFVIGSNSMLAGDSVGFKSVSLNSGYIPTIPAPQSYNAVFLDCQYYYEVSAITTTEQLPTQTGGGTTITLISRGFDIGFERKRALPAIQFNSPQTSTIDKVSGVIYNGGAVVTPGDITVSANWKQNNLSKVAANYTPTNVNPLLVNAVGGYLAPEAFIAIQFNADARLGVVL